MGVSLHGGRRIGMCTFHQPTNTNHTPCLCPHMTQWPHVVIVTITHLHARTHIRTHKHTLAHTDTSPNPSQMLQTSHHATRDLTHTCTHTHPQPLWKSHNVTHTHWPHSSCPRQSSRSQSSWIQSSVGETGVGCCTDWLSQCCVINVKIQMCVLHMRGHPCGQWSI